MVGNMFYMLYLVVLKEIQKLKCPNKQNNDQKERKKCMHDAGLFRS